MAAAAMSRVTAPIGYAPAGTVVADQERPGLLRSPTRERSTAYDDRGVAFEVCAINEIDGAGPGEPGLISLLGEIRDAGEAGDEQATRLRSLLTGAAIELADGSRLRVDHVADESVIVRHAGPGGIEVDAAEHHGAVNVHIDQDVLGTPLRQLFDPPPDRLSSRACIARTVRVALTLGHLWDRVLPTTIYECTPVGEVATRCVPAWLRFGDGPGRHGRAGVAVPGEVVPGGVGRLARPGARRRDR